MSTDLEKWETLLRFDEPEGEPYRVGDHWMLSRGGAGIPAPRYHDDPAAACSLLPKLHAEWMKHERLNHWWWDFWQEFNEENAFGDEDDPSQVCDFIYAAVVSVTKGEAEADLEAADAGASAVPGDAPAPPEARD